MEEKMSAQKAIQSIKDAWAENGNTLSWDMAGDALVILAVLGLTVYVIKYAKNFKEKVDE